MQSKQVQQGLALMVLVFILAFAAVAYTIHALDKNGIDQKRNQKTSEALAEAKMALLGMVSGVEYVFDPISDQYLPPYLPNPDLASPPTKDEGAESLAFGSQDFSLVGKLPWRSLGVAALKDGWGECLWYAVSGRFKKSPATSVYNWDTAGQIDVVDENGTDIANNLVALIISPASPISGQDRSLSDAKYSQCGGNYEPRNYLDTYDLGNAISGEVNYFAGGTDNRRATNTNNKTFVLANNEFYNDKFVFITVDDVFDSLIKRQDFVDGVNLQLDYAVQDIINYSVAADGYKGTNNIDCNIVLPLNIDRTFCRNWSEMFLLKENVKVNGVSCRKVFIFSGKQTSSQQRLTTSDKNDPENYLEGTNLVAFNAVTVENFTGSDMFDGSNPSADVVRCIPW